MRRPLRDSRPIGPFFEGQRGITSGYPGTSWPFRQPTEQEVNEIYQYHVEDLGMTLDTAHRHVHEEYLVVLDKFVPDDVGYEGKVAFALADHVEDWAIYYWPEGEVDILASSGSEL